MELLENELLFAKVREGAKIPCKNEEDGGMDIYACFDEDFIIIPTFETKLIPTGIASAMTYKYRIMLEERGSTGTKGMKRSAGLIDSGFRGEWFVAISNITYNTIIISKLTMEQLVEKYGVTDHEGDIRLKTGEGEYDYEYLTIDGEFVDCTIYPYEKAIAQALVQEVPPMIICEVDYEDLIKIASKRGTGALGSSGK